VNWSDASYRKPTNKLEVFGRTGKILADQHGLKVFSITTVRNTSSRKAGTTSTSPMCSAAFPFYVRGIEFTAQLYHFVDKIKSATDRRTRCSFTDASATLSVIEDIFRDSANLEKEIS